MSQHAPEQTLNVQDIIKMIRRHLVLIIALMTLSEVVAIGLAKSLPKKFKTSALLNLKSSYFEVPGVGEGLSYAEVQAQKQALLRLALDDAFMDEEGTKYSLFKSKEGTVARESEREGLRKRIDFMSSSATTFRITAIGQTASVAYGLTSDTLDQIVTVLVHERHKTLTLHRDSLVKQLEAMGVTGSSHALVGSANARIEFLTSQIARAEEQVAALRDQYTADHPKAIQAEAQLRDLKRQLERIKNPSSSDAGARSGGSAGPLMIDPNVKDGRGNLGEELLKKINYLDIALALEGNTKDHLYLEVLERPLIPDGYIFPNPLAFAVGGLLFGFLLSGMGITFLELRLANVLTPLAASRQLGVPLLGAMPAMVNRPPRQESARGRDRRP
jgi:hypothetical protein